MPRPRRAVAAGLVLALALTGCGSEDPDPAATDPTAPEATASEPTGSRPTASGSQGATASPTPGGSPSEPLGGTASPSTSASPATASPDPGAATEVTITSTAISFDVAEVTVPAGVPITFTYDNQQDGVPHNLHVSGPGVDEATTVEPGPVTQTLTVTFPEAGTYDYVCDVHPGQMQGVVTAV